MSERIAASDSRHASKPSQLSLPPLLDRFHSFTLYETKHRYYLVATTLTKAHYRVLKIDRTSLSLDLVEDPAHYSAADIQSLVAMIDASSGGILSVTHCSAIIGFIRFLLGWYLYIVTDSVEVGRLGVHRVYSVCETSLIALTHPSVYDSGSHNALHKRHRTNEQKYRSLFLLVDLSKFFYYSPTYDLTRTLQDNMVHGRAKHRDMYVWNYSMRPKVTSMKDEVSVAASPRSRTVSRLTLREDWCAALVHGSFEQRTLSVFGRPLTLTLIARRSRHYAGTRYLKRGVCSRGHAANDVETEQILHDRLCGDARDGVFVSHCSVRGSIPIHWTQSGNAMIAQPDIVIQRPDPLYEATKKHLCDLWQRYNSPVLVLNLVKQSERRKRECIIGNAWNEALSYLNSFIDSEHRVDYHAFDFKKVSQSKTLNVMDELTVIAQWTLQRTGLFHSKPLSDARQVLARDTVNVRPTRGSLELIGVRGLPVRKATADIRDEDEAEPKTSVSEADALSARIQPNARDDWKLDRTGSDWSARSGGDYSGTQTPASAPFNYEDYELDSAGGLLTAAANIRSLLPSSSFSATEAINCSQANASVDGLSQSVYSIASVQRGVCRVNCVDSLDRTNVAAYCIGHCALGYQLYALSLIDSPIADNFGAIGSVLLDMYERMGDAIALQYGGSQMHRQVKKDANHSNSQPSAILTKQSSLPNNTSGSKSQPGYLSVTSSLLNAFKPNHHQSKELFVSLMRHYQNSFQDTAKQDAINLFLGLFAPSLAKDGAHLWEMASDFYLHNHLPGSEDNDRDTLEAVRNALYSNNDKRWWQSPILAHEQSLGQLALPVSVIFSAPYQSSSSSSSSSLGSAFSASTPSIQNTAAAYDRDRNRDRSSSSPPSNSPEESLTAAISNDDDDKVDRDASMLASLSSIELAHHPNINHAPIASIASTASLASSSESIQSIGNSSTVATSLRFLASYGPADTLDEFDSMLQSLTVMSTHNITILGQAEPASLPKSMPKLKPKSRSKRRRHASSTDSESEVDEERREWEAEHRREFSMAERQRQARIYASDSIYALPVPRPSLPPSTLQQYQDFLSLSADELLVPEFTVNESERDVSEESTMEKFHSGTGGTGRDRYDSEQKVAEPDSRRVSKTGDDSSAIRRMVSFPSQSSPRQQPHTATARLPPPDLTKRSPMTPRPRSPMHDRSPFSAPAAIASRRTSNSISDLSLSPSAHINSVTHPPLSHSQTSLFDYYYRYYTESHFSDALWQLCFASHRAAVIGDSSQRLPTVPINFDADFDLYERYLAIV